MASASTHAAPPPIRVRNGERQKSWFRSERYFQADGAWFIATREGVDVGPFQSEQETRKHAARLITRLCEVETVEEAQRVALEYKNQPEQEEEQFLRIVGLRQFSRKL